MSEPLIESKWLLAPAPSAKMVDLIITHTHLHLVAARIAAQRITSEEDIAPWFNALKEPFCDPYAFHDMRIAVERLKIAIKERSPILIFGDYDTDGISATALMVKALTQCNAVVTHFIPDREREGYGLTVPAMERALQLYPETQLIVTVDCGITSVTEVEMLNARGLEVIITDHHVPLEQLPPAFAIVNPKLGAPHGAESLCGCATAFMVVRALFERFNLDSRDFLDLVAVATVADVMPLTGENRSLVTKGLCILHHPNHGNQGLYTLLQEQQVQTKSLTAEDLAYKIIPCINAASRIGDWDRAYQLFMLEISTASHADYISMKADCVKAARLLKTANEERKKLENTLRKTLTDTVTQHDGNVIIAAGTKEEGFHPGILGIVAARLAEQHHHPAVVCTIKENGSVNGSMRSMGAWHAVHALETVADLCEHFGGHAAAAGFSLKPGTFDAFKERFPKAFEAHMIEDEVIMYDDELVEPIDNDLMVALDKLEPYGTANPKPRFAKRFVLDNKRTIGKDRTHIELTLIDLSDRAATPIRAVWFGAAKRVDTWHIGIFIRAIFTLSRNRLTPNQIVLHIIDALPIS